MGCDYYTYYKICIQYRKGDTVEIEEKIEETTRQQHYLHFRERDVDFEELDEYNSKMDCHYKCQMDRYIEQYERKDIFKVNNWLCIESAKEKYLNICKECNILESDIIAIWKQGGCEHL
jgi:hypothetical protein